MAELSTWEKKLTSDRDQLLADIATTERDLAREQDIAHGRLQAVPRGATALALVEETALEKLPRLEAKLGVQRRALSSIEFAITQAPPRVAAFQKTLAPLAHALTMRDEAMYEAEENFRELLAALLVLRKANTDATARLTTAMKAWGDAGHLATELPAFASTRWSAEIRGWLRNFRAENYSTPFITIELDDDLSGPLARAYPESLHPEAAVAFSTGVDD